MRHLIRGSLVCVLTAALAAQTPPAPPPPAPAPGPAAPAEKDLPGLIEKLGAADYDARQAATESLRALGEKARPALEAAAKSESLERRTRAGMLLRELDLAAIGPGGGESGVRPLRPEEPGEPGQELRPFPLPGIPGGIEIRPGRGGTMRGFSITLGGPGPTVTTTTNGPEGEMVTMSRDGRGRLSVRVERVDPRTGMPVRPEVFEAQDLASFKTQHPAIYEKYRGLGIFDDQDTFGWVDVPGGIRGGFPPGQELRPDPIVPEPSGPVLGVTLGDVPPALRAHVDLPEKAVLVETVVAGTAAEKIGLQPFDVITHIDGREVGSSDDIRAALADPSAPGKLAVRCFRKGKPIDLEGPRPAPR